MSTENIIIKAEKRTTPTKGDVRRLRTSGFVPANVYGKNGAQSVSIALKGLPKQHTRSSVIKLDVEGSVKSVLMREVQVDPLTDLPIHIDFQEVAGAQTVKIKVPLEFVGLTREQEKEGSFKILLRSLEVIASAQDLPKALQVKVGHLKVDQSAHVSDIDLPQNITVAAKRDLALASLVG